MTVMNKTMSICIAITVMNKTMSMHRNTIITSAAQQPDDVPGQWSDRQDNWLCQDSWQRHLQDNWQVNNIYNK